MNQILKVLCSLVAGCVLGNPGVFAAEQKLFNGTDLSGWDGEPGWWRVEDGAITSESTPEKPCRRCTYLIWTGGEPGDFELTADFRLSKDANSGIQIRSEKRPKWDTYGYQADMTGNGALIGYIYHHKRGLMVPRGAKVRFDAEGKRQAEKLGNATELLKHYKPEQWNTLKIVCRGPEITTYVNDVLMSQLFDQDPKVAASRGILALQMHPGKPMKIQFKNLVLKTP